MFEKNSALALILVVCLGLICGFGLGYALKPVPEPVIEVTVHGVFVNGKKIDLKSFFITPPALPKKKSGDIGEIAQPAAMLNCPCGDSCQCSVCNCPITIAQVDEKDSKQIAAYYFPIEQKHIIRNMASTVDGLGINVPCCLETVANCKGFSDLKGFAEFTKARAGGHWTEKIKRQFDEYAIGKQFVVSMVIHDFENSDKSTISTLLPALLKAHGPVVVAYNGSFDEHYNGHTVATAFVVNGHNPEKKTYSFVDPNYPQDRISMAAEKMNKGCNWIVCLMPAVLPKPRPVALPQVIEQRGGQPSKPVEAFGIEVLANVLKELKEAIFGDKQRGTPGLRDDIAHGLSDFYSTLRNGVLIAGVATAGWMFWVGWNLHRIANASEARVLQVK